MTKRERDEEAAAIKAATAEKRVRILEQKAKREEDAKGFLGADESSLQILRGAEIVMGKVVVDDNRDEE
eukprot:scaffold7241_cov156-Ochromonas_danica.AAC.3